jgi:hypothetical protein
MTSQFVSVFADLLDTGGEGIEVIQYWGVEFGWASVNKWAFVKSEMCETSDLYCCSSYVGWSIYTNLNFLFLASSSTHGNVLHFLCTKFLKWMRNEKAICMIHVRN